MNAWSLADTRFIEMNLHRRSLHRAPAAARSNGWSTLVELLDDAVRPVRRFPPCTMGGCAGPSSVTVTGSQSNARTGYIRWNVVVGVVNPLSSSAPVPLAPRRTGPGCYARPLIGSSILQVPCAASAAPPPRGTLRQPGPRAQGFVFTVTTPSKRTSAASGTQGNCRYAFSFHSSYGDEDGPLRVDRISHERTRFAARTCVLPRRTASPHGPSPQFVGDGHGASIRSTPHQRRHRLPHDIGRRCRATPANRRLSVTIRALIDIESTRQGPCGDQTALCAKSAVQKPQLAAGLYILSSRRTRRSSQARQWNRVIGASSPSVFFRSAISSLKVELARRGSITWWCLLVTSRSSSSSMWALEAPFTDCEVRTSCPTETRRGFSLGSSSNSVDDVMLFETSRG